MGRRGRRTARVGFRVAEHTRYRNRIHPRHARASAKLRHQRQQHREQSGQVEPAIRHRELSYNGLRVGGNTGEFLSTPAPAVMAGRVPIGVKLAGLRADFRHIVMVREGAPSTPCGAD